MRMSLASHEYSADNVRRPACWLVAAPASPLAATSIHDGRRWSLRLTDSGAQRVLGRDERSWEHARCCTLSLAEHPLFRITDHRTGLDKVATLAAQRPVVDPDRRWCTWMYETGMSETTPGRAGPFSALPGRRSVSVEADLLGAQPGQAARSRH